MYQASQTPRQCVVEHMRGWRFGWLTSHLEPRAVFNVYQLARSAGNMPAWGAPWRTSMNSGWICGGGSALLPFYWTGFLLWGLAGLEQLQVLQWDQSTRLSHTTSMTSGHKRDPWRWHVRLSWDPLEKGGESIRAFWVKIRWVNLYFQTPHVPVTFSSGRDPDCAYMERKRLGSSSSLRTCRSLWALVGPCSLQCLTCGPTDVCGADVLSQAVMPTNQNQRTLSGYWIVEMISITATNQPYSFLVFPFEGTNQQRNQWCCLQELLWDFNKDGQNFQRDTRGQSQRGEGTCRRLISGGILNPRVWGLTPPPLSTCEDLSWSLSSYEICVIIPKCRWYPRNSPTSRVNMIFSTNGARTTGICMRKNKAGPLLHIININ